MRNSGIRESANLVQEWLFSLHVSKKKKKNDGATQGTHKSMDEKREIVGTKLREFVSDTKHSHMLKCCESGSEC